MNIACALGGALLPAFPVHCVALCILIPKLCAVVRQVLRWSDASYLEDQDMWRLSGIQRAVRLLTKPPSHITDFSIATPLTFKPAEGSASGVELAGARLELAVHLVRSLLDCRSESCGASSLTMHQAVIRLTMCGDMANTEQKIAHQMDMAISQASACAYRSMVCQHTACAQLLVMLYAGGPRCSWPVGLHTDRPPHQHGRWSNMREPSGA